MLINSLAQTNPIPNVSSLAQGAFGILIVVGIIALLWYGFRGTYLMFKKAGYKGWECLIPVYSQAVVLEMAGLPQLLILLWIVGLFFSMAGLAYNMAVGLHVAKKFGRSDAFGIIVCGFVPLIGYAIIGFDPNSRYIGDNPNSNRSSAAR